MSVKIRLSTVGKRNQIQYRIVAQDTHTKRDGKFLEILGSFNPQGSESAKLKVKKDVLESWLSRGAKLTYSVEHLIKNGTLPKKVKKIKPPEEQKQPVSKPKDDQTESVNTQTTKVDETTKQTTPNNTPPGVPEQKKQNKTEPEKTN